MSKERQPESQETFDDSFSKRGLTTTDVWAEWKLRLGKCRQEAAELAKKWFLEHGYFNGRMEGFIYHHELEQRVDVKVVLTDYGLPNTSEVEHE